MKIVVPKLKGLILRLTGRFILLVLSMVQSVPISSKKSPDDLIYHFAKNHSYLKPDFAFKCKLCYQEFPLSYASRQNKNNQDGFPIKTTNVDPDDVKNEVDDANSTNELRSCQHLLVNSDLDQARHKVFNSGIENLNAGQKAGSILQQLKVCIESESSSCIHFQKYSRWGVHIFLRTRKQYPAGSMQTCVHHGRLGKV